MNILRELPDGAYDLAVVDPPYFDRPDKLGYYGARISNVGVRRPSYEAKHWAVPDASYFKELKRVSKNQIVWGCNYYDYRFGAGRIVWDKVNGTSSFSDCEIAYCSLIDTVRMFRFMWNGMCQGKSISEGHIQQGNKKLNERRIRPTQKLVALYKWLLSNYANPGYRILDTHGGSMSIALACHDMDYELTLIEKDSDYFNAGRQRLLDYQRQQKLF